MIQNLGINYVLRDTGCTDGFSSLVLSRERGNHAIDYY